MAFSTEIVQDSDSKATEVTIYVRTNARRHLKTFQLDISCDSTGMSSIEPNSIEMRTLYEPGSGRTDYAADFTTSSL